MNGLLLPRASWPPLANEALELPEFASVRLLSPHKTSPPPLCEYRVDFGSLRHVRNTGGGYGRFVGFVLFDKARRLINSDLMAAVVRHELVKLHSGHIAEDLSFRQTIVRHRQDGANFEGHKPELDVVADDPVLAGIADHLHLQCRGVQKDLMK